MSAQPVRNGTPAWPENLDIAGLRPQSWTPVPFRQYVVKLHGRCNLSCDYCYLYQMADDTWKYRPAVMAPATIGRVCERIAEHVSAHNIGLVNVVAHGGEPLLAGAASLTCLATRLRAALATVSTPVTSHLSVQTNGVLLTEPMLRVLREQGYRVGVSIDGGASANDRHRRYADGRGSHAAVARGLRRLTGDRYRELFAGLLCTVDLANDPLDTYGSLLAYRPPVIDFLLPHGNWSTPPPGRVPHDPATPYGDWLATVFDHWYAAPRSTGIRLFDEIIQLVLGGRSSSEVIGLSPYAAVVIETDGSLEQVDTLKSAYHGAAATGLHVDTDPFDAALAHPGVVARQIGLAALAEQCRRCPVVDICGGGCYTHRYEVGAGYRNPSVYCPDLLFLVQHIRRRVARDLAAPAATPAPAGAAAGTGAHDYQRSP